MKRPFFMERKRAAKRKEIRNTRAHTQTQIHPTIGLCDCGALSWSVREYSRNPDGTHLLVHIIEIQVKKIKPRASHSSGILNGGNTGTRTHTKANTSIRTRATGFILPLCGRRYPFHPSNKHPWMHTRLTMGTRIRAEAG